MILVVEDDRAIRNLIATTLETQGYRYHLAATGGEGLAEAVSNRPDVLLLDLGLPDMDGVDVIRKIRGWSEMPILVVSARSDDRDKVEALDEGADDYLVKPFSVDELLARLRVALRRVRREASRTRPEETVYRNGDLTIDYEAGVARRGDQELHLTPMEYKLLCLLAKNTGKVLTQNYILKEIWGIVMASDTSSLRVFMATLRKKIEPCPSKPIYIQTRVGIGYRMTWVDKTPEE
ncbi:MAG: response regulator transcription factor [Oscillospiraceae bacterium]|nr:response regulator transcription factor [Oscillospiraceae bacterium]